ncbi:unnamed protein product [Prunus armeniaca]
MVSSWPFTQWRLDLIGPMPEGKGQVKYTVVVVDYFTKWAEAEALAIITAARIETFIWHNIVCRFGIPHTIVTDNGETLFSLSFGTEVVALVEIGQPTYRISTYDAEANDKQLALNLDFIYELRDNPTCATLRTNSVSPSTMTPGLRQQGNDI